MPHPLLERVADHALWAGRDRFPSCPEWADEVEEWLRFIERQGQFGRYLPRLRGLPTQRDETLAEISAGYFLSTKCNLPILAWEPTGSPGKRGDFLLGRPGWQPIFVEIKSPGWEMEIAAQEGPDSPRLLQEKHLPGVECRSTEPAVAIRYAVSRAARQLPDSRPTLVVLVDDLAVELNDWPETVERSLYASEISYRRQANQKRKAEMDAAETAPFVSANGHRIGAVAILNIDLPGPNVRYRFRLFRNPNAQPVAIVPMEPFSAWPVQDRAQ